MGLLSRFNRPDKTPVHSSGLAEVNDGSTRALGAMKHESFEQRRQIESNRQHIGAYRGAALAQPSRRPAGPSPSSDTAPRRPSSRIDVVKPSRQQTRAQSAGKPNAHSKDTPEHDPHGYHPYS